MSGINTNGLEDRAGNTPDFVMNEFLEGVLDLFGEAVQAREMYYGVKHETAVFRDGGKYDFSDCATAEEAIFQALGAASGVAMRANPDWDFSSASAQFAQIGNALCSRLSVAKEDR